MTHPKKKLWAAALVPVLLLTAILLFAQSTPNSQFRETAVIPFFHKRDPEIVHFRTFYRKDLDGTHTLLLVRGGRWSLGPAEDFWGNSDELLGLFLMKTDAPDLVWELAILSSEHRRVEVERVDHSSIVLWVAGHYGRGSKIKFFFDVESKRVLKRLEFPPMPVLQILSLNDELYFVIGTKEHYFVVTQEQKVISRLDEGRPIVVGGAERDLVLARAREELAADVSRLRPSVRVCGEYLPIGSQGHFAVSIVPETVPVGENCAVEGIAERAGDDTKLYELPKSTHEEFARARPKRAAQSGYRPHQPTFKSERVGPYQISGNRFWFAKTFYDGEGLTGVGGFGYFDPEERRYVVFSPPEITPWSASALLVEEKKIWLGLLGRPEGAKYSGGLLRYERDSGKVEIFDVDEVITQIKRWRDLHYLGTANGLYILKNNLLVHYVFEPTLDGGTDIFKFKSQPLKSR